jgi:hypothetical protein
MPRFTKVMSHELINFVKSMKIRANYFHPKSTSAFEFARQMGSSKLKKVNPAFEFSFVVDDQNSPGDLRVEFINGRVWEKSTDGDHCEDLRSQFYSICQEIDDHYDKTGESRPNGGGAAEVAAGGGKGKGAAASGGKGGKK